MHFSLYKITLIENNINILKNEWLIKLAIKNINLKLDVI